MSYSNSPINSTCPVCGSSKGSVLYTVDSVQVAKHFLYTSNALNDERLKLLSEHIATKLWKRPKAEVVECTVCKFCYGNPFVSGDYLFYNLMEHGQPGGLNESWDWEFEEAKLAIKKITKKNANASLLEVGASTGNFIRKIVGDLIDKENILCLEYSEVGVAEIKKLGIEALSKDVRDLSAEPTLKGKFNIICLFQVFEHLDNYDKLFATFDYLSPKDAHLFIAVPNGERIKFNELNGGLLDLPPNHLGRFNKESFETISKKYNWTIEDLKIQEETYQQIFGGLLYYRSLQKKILSDKEPTKLELLLDYIAINIIKLKILLKRKKIGDNIFIHLKKAAA